MGKEFSSENPALSIIERTKMSQEQKSTAKPVVTRKKLEKQEKCETKSLLMSMRIRPSTKERFEKLRKIYRYSQSDFFDALVAIAEEQAVNDGFTG